MMTENEISRIVVDTALKIHKTLGPGLLESVYEVVLAHELRSRGLKVQRLRQPSASTKSNRPVAGALPVVS